MERMDAIDSIKGIGDKTRELYHKLDIHTVEDLLEHYPRSYESYEEIVAIKDLHQGDTAIIEASLVALPAVKKAKGLSILTVRARDYSGDILLTWFNMPFLKKTLKLGMHYLFRGRISKRNQQYNMEQPQILTREVYIRHLHELIPVYSLTKGLTSHNVGKAVRTVLKEAELTEYLPLALRKKYQLMTYREAMQTIHFPKDMAALTKARRRIVFDEFFLFSLAIAKLKKDNTKKKSNFVWEKKKECEECIASLPYALTNAQKKVIEEVENDTSQGYVMNRLVQGDVGSGKTIIAAIALLKAVKNGAQGALMVPTEVLAAQHYESLQQTLGKFDVRICLLVGSMTAKEKRICYEKIKNKEVDVIIGTHALIQEKVVYANLGLVITDEQHRFGVRQRQNLSEKGFEPHILVMSATPIPRTLAIIMYGDLELSVIDELPAERLPIKNCVVNTDYRPTAYRFIEKELAKGRQAYIICPMVEESEAMEAENVMDYTEKLRSAIAPGILVEYLHGKMKGNDKNEIMERFAKGEIQVLVSTTVVEVGVNVPNASVMMIENAERFGLAQLHQLRGRVGRGAHQSYCILVHGTDNKKTRERLEILNQSNDGFFIAKEDLRLRGPGDFFGIRQSGLLEFKMADVFQDANILVEANQAAAEWSELDLGQMRKRIDDFFYQCYNSL